MKTVILAGGLGTRLSEFTTHLPKPMVPIGGRPILWHIMRYYAHFGFMEFVIALGYKGELVKEYFQRSTTEWEILPVDTGLHTKTGGRLKRLKEWLGSETFFVSFGDVLTDLDLHALLDYHKKERRLATFAAVRPPPRLSPLDLEKGSTPSQVSDGWVNGGFFALEPEVLDFIDDDSVWESGVIERLAKEKQLSAYCHSGFFHTMENVLDHGHLEALWHSERAPWHKAAR